MPSFLEALAAKPELLGTVAVVALKKAGVDLGNVQATIAAASALPTWSGTAKDAFSQNKAATLFDQLSKVIGGMAQTQTAVAAGGAQIQASKAAMDAAVMLATAEGFKVLPTGAVILGPRLRAAAAARPEIKPALYARAAQHTAIIKAAHAQTNVADAQLALTIAKVAVDVLGGMLNKNGAATGVPGTTVPLPPTTPLPPLPPLPPLTPLPPTSGQPLPGTVPATAFTPTGSDTSLPGTQLAGAGSLGGAGAGGAGALSGAAVAATSLSPGSALSGGAVGGGPAQLVPGSAAGRGGAPAVPPPMMGGGAAGHAPHSEEGSTAATTGSSRTARPGVGRTRRAA
ncbi:hypothetical protein ACFQ1L_27040 [Phytohabitans flavus]|uniref:hypothetical protein n=1 Tax=Phytohabitans flavus TaxID=1076124 RepID=UPI00362D8B6D